MALAIPESIAKSAITALNTVTGALDEAADRVATWISWKFALVFVFAGITAVANQNYLTCLELGDHIPIRSLPYFKARRLLSTLLIPVTSPSAP